MSEFDSEEHGNAERAVRAVYEDLSRRTIERSCTLQTRCCRFRETGGTPYLTRGEALVAARAVRRSGRVKLREPENGDCPLLDADDRCSIYADRPFGCRTHFCRDAGGPYARSEVLDLIRRLETADEMLGGEGGQPLPSAVDWALRELSERPRPMMRPRRK